MLRRKLYFAALLMSACGAAAAQTTVPGSTAQPISIIDGPRIEYLDDKSAKVAWTSSAEGSVTVRYGIDRNNLSMIAQEPWGGKKVDGTGAIHRVELKNLRPNTTYYFTVESGQAREGGGAVANSDVQTLKTKTVEQAEQDWRAVQHRDIKAGPIAMNVTDRQAILWWSARGGPDDGKAAIVKYGKNKNRQSESRQSPAGHEHRVTLGILEPATTYYFTITSAEGRLISIGELRTEDAAFAHSEFQLTSGPVIEVIGKNSAVIAWSTNRRSSTTVRYGTDPATLDQTAQAPWGQQSHRVRITGLKPNTRYYFTVESAQAEGTGLSAKSNTAQFITVGEGERAINFSSAF